MGGKWTTYRLMAKDTIDQIYEHLWQQNPVVCTSDHQLLHGAEGYRFEDWEKLSAQYQVSPAIAQHLMKKYGVFAEKVLKLTDNQPELKALIHPNHPFIKAEIVYVIQEEMAMTSTHVLCVDT
eukprot:Opistho-1_new@42368